MLNYGYGFQIIRVVMAISWRRIEFPLALFGIFFFAWLLAPGLFGDPIHERLVRERLMTMESADTVLLLDSELVDGSLQYTLNSVWRDRAEPPLPWAKGEVIPRFSRLYFDDKPPPQQMVVFYRVTEGEREWRLSVMVRDGAVNINLKPNRWLRQLFGSDTPLETFHRYVQEGFPFEHQPPVKS